MEKEYGKRLNPFQAALMRPEVAIGSIETKQKQLLLIDEEGKTAVSRSVLCNDGLYRIIQEVGSNCIDNKWKTDTPLKSIKITTDRETGEITFWNDGACIPVEKSTYEYKDHRTQEVTVEELHPAEVFFGDMNSGTKFKDDKRKTAGMNGLGAKLANVFSKEFTVEHTNPEEKLKFIQTFTENATTRTKPKISTFRNKTGYTKISFTPDYEYFKYPGLTPDLDDIIKTYAYEISMVSGVPVYFNSQKIVIKTLAKYCDFFFPQGRRISLESGGDECVIVQNTEPEVKESISVEHKSFVNGMSTTVGGTHILKWANSVIPGLVKAINLKFKKEEFKVTAKGVNPYCIFVLRVEMENPKFSNNTKTELTSPYILEKTPEFKEVIEKTIKKMSSWEFVSIMKENIYMKTVEKSGKKESGIFKSNKLSDADEAGGSKSMSCLLFVNEGASAKTMSERGTDSLTGGRKFYGSFAVQGKVINTRTNTLKNILKNKEINALKKILGLRKEADYTKSECRKELRYGKGVCILTDADDDGIHIKGLLLNFFYEEYPTLLKCGYVTSLSTAVASVTLKGKKRKQLFYSLPEFKAWEKDNKSKIKHVDYYKGLGSIPPKSVAQYFQNQKIVEYYLDGTEVESMALGFDKPTAEKKTWIKQRLMKIPELEQYAGKSEDSRITEEFIYDGRLSVSKFVNEQLIIYHLCAVRRCLPCIWDGLKEGQRKALYTMRLKNYKTMTDFEKILGDIKSSTEYHHGSSSQEKTLKRMGLVFVGTNNIPFVKAGGEFGSRKGSAKDSAAARYIKTKLRNITHKLFRKEDDELLSRLSGDNGQIEYSFFLPIIPTILVNGCKGIACGFSTDIPCYNPQRIIEWIRSWIKERTSKKVLLLPYYRGFTGKTVIHKKDGKLVGWESFGNLVEKEKGWWSITEVPVGKGFDEIIDFLTYLKYGKAPEGYKGWPQLDKRQISRVELEEVSINFINNARFKVANGFEPSISENFDVLRKKFSLNNMVCIDECGYPYKFETPEDILKAFCERRLIFYMKRKELQLKTSQEILLKLKNKIRFIKAVNNDFEISKYTDKNLMEEMTRMEFDKIDGNFEYLLSMQIRTLTLERVGELEKQEKKERDYMNIILSTTPEIMWLNDLKELEDEYAIFLVSIDKELRTASKLKSQK